VDVKKSFLKQSYSDNWDIFQKSLQKSSFIPKWDMFIITASNEEQAEAYRLQIEHRRKNGYLPPQTEFMVIPDPQGKRVGSGGATLNAFYEIYSGFKSHDNNPFYNKRIMIIHSGGDSKRIPQYSAFGKLFSKVPRELPDGRYSTLFDEFLISLSGLPSRMKDGVVIASGDVLLLLNHNQIDLGRQGAVGISMKSPAEMATHHGVYLSDEEYKVDSFLHKMPLEILKEKGAVDASGMASIDTGLLWMDSDVTYNLLKLILTEGVLDRDKYNLFINDKLRLNFYGDFLIPLTKNAELDSYLKEETEGEYCKDLITVRKDIWKAISGFQMYIQNLSPAEFIHFGTTAEFRDLMNKIDNEYNYLSWKNKVVSCYKEDVDFKSETFINSYIGENVILGNRVLIEDSRVKCAKIREGCIISNIDIDNDKIELMPNIVMHQLPVICKDGRKGYVTRIYGVYDNPKDTIESGKCTLFNRNFEQATKELGISNNELWGHNVDKNLWNAKLYPICSTSRESIDMALKMQSIDYMTEETRSEWLSMEKLSLKESYEIADEIKIIKAQDSIEDLVRINKFIQNVKQGVYVKHCANLLGSSSEQVKRRVNLLKEFIDVECNTMDKVKLYRAASEVLKIYSYNDCNDESEFHWNDFEDMAFSELNSAIKKSTIMLKDSNIKFIKGESVVEAAARVNFGGGWSDTPPYSIESGGNVLNAAINLKGMLPIKVITKVLKEPIVEFKSTDQNITKVFTSLEDILDYSDPTDPVALHKAALVVTGIIPQTLFTPYEEDTIDKEAALAFDASCLEKYELKEILKNLGGGISITTMVSIPKGSGLGTSSILAGAVLKSLDEILGLNISEYEIFDQVLCLEQFLTTGGGWQDQVGGLTPGIKLVTSKKGLPQKLTYENINIDDRTLKELRDRFVLVYTGQRRLAKGILREIMGKYIINDPSMIEHLSQIQKLALMMKFELEKGNVDNFAMIMNEHWEVSKKLDSGSTNTYIDQIINLCRPYISGVMICGAGGGGFLQMILKDADKKEELRAFLKDVFHDNKIGIWDCELI
jgi:fucokinase